MNRLIPRLAIIAALTVSSLCAAESELTLRVSQAFVPCFDLIAKQFAKTHPEATFSINGCGSEASIKAIGTGDAVLGATMRALKAGEKTTYPDLVLTPFACDAVALLVNGDNPLNDLTTKQVQDLVTGVTTNWKQLGGHEEAVAVISLTDTNAAVPFFEQIFGLEHKMIGEGKAQTMSYRIKGAADYPAFSFPVTGTNKEVAARVVTESGAFSYGPSGIAQAMKAKGAALKILSLDGVAPSDEAVRNKTYRLNRVACLITKGEPQGLLKAYIDFVLSTDGQKLVTQSGNVALKP